MIFVGIFGLLITLAMICLGLILVGAVGSISLFVLEWAVKIVILLIIVRIFVKATK